MFDILQQYSFFFNFTAKLLNISTTQTNHNLGVLKTLNNTNYYDANMMKHRKNK